MGKSSAAKNKVDLQNKYSELFSAVGFFRSVIQKEANITDASLQLQPISSFSTFYSIARSFGSGSFGASGNQTVLAVQVPVEHILSTATTGFGCLSEGEVTVLAHPLKGQAVTVRSSGELPATEEALLRILGKSV